MAKSNFSLAHSPISGSRRAWAPLCLGLGLLAGCQTPNGAQAPSSPSTPWVADDIPAGRSLQPSAPPPAPPPRLSREPTLVWPPTEEATTAATTRALLSERSAAPAAPQFRLPALADAAEFEAAPQDLPDHPASLAELIDLAQRHNPLTRVAWEQARQAALDVGMAESLLLPLISATVVAGYQRTNSPLPYAIGDIDQVRTSARGVVPALTLQWLLFDFGEQQALVDGARQLSFGANVQFQGAHQRLIQAVALAYYQYDAARLRTATTAQALANARTVLDAVQARQEQGIATTIELAQARQQVAQARLLHVQAEGLERDTYQALIAAIGLPPTTKLEIARQAQRALPTALHDLTEQRLREALAQRPDVLSAYAAAQAAQSGISAAEAAFRPKVFLTGIAAVTRNNNLNVNGLSFLGQPVNAAGVLLGVTVPLYDGGLRSRRLSAAQSRADQAVDAWRQSQEDAVLEVVTASNQLRSALEAHQAAQEWVATADTTYDAALEAYEYGVGTVTVATEATMDVLAARMAEIDARAAAHSAATTLAYAMGQLTSADDVAADPRRGRHLTSSPSRSPHTP